MAHMYGGPIYIDGGSICIGSGVVNVDDKLLAKKDTLPCFLMANSTIALLGFKNFTIFPYPSSSYSLLFSI